MLFDCFEGMVTGMQPADNKSNTSMNEGITYLRIIACMGVFATHIGQVVIIPKFLRHICRAGASGPYLFFVISGLLMMKSVDLAEGNNKKYIYKRLKRILPAYYFSLMLHFVIYAVGEKIQLPAWTISDGVWNYRWLRYIFCVNTILPADNEIWSNMGAVWSVSCFLLFYLIAPWIYRYVKNWKWAILFLGAFLGISFLWKADMLFPDLLISTMPYFLSGVCVFTIFYSRVQGHWLLVSYGTQRWPRLLCLAGCFLMCLGAYNDKVPERFLHWGIIIVLVYGAMLLEGKKRIINEWITFLDRRSYAVYLMHPVAFLLIKGIKEMTHFTGEAQSGANLIVFMSAVVLTAVLVELEYRLEHKFIQSLDKRIEGRMQTGF